MLVVKINHIVKVQFSTFKPVIKSLTLRCSVSNILECKCGDINLKLRFSFSLNFMAYHHGWRTNNVLYPWSCWNYEIFATELLLPATFLPFPFLFFIITLLFALQLNKLAYLFYTSYSFVFLLYMLCNVSSSRVLLLHLINRVRSNCIFLGNGGCEFLLLMLQTVIIWASDMFSAFSQTTDAVSLLILVALKRNEVLIWLEEFSLE